MYDVVVVGGNLSGASAAIHAASKDLNVALVERNKQPHLPAYCGEAIHKDTLEYFDLYDMDYIKNPIMELIINVGPKEYSFKYKEPFQMIIDRNYIENELLNRAKKLGVKLFLGVGMKDFNEPNDIILTDGSILKGKIIIDSSGLSCRVGKKIGLAPDLRPEDIGVCIQSRVQGKFDEKIMKLWFHRPFAPFGYAYLFPFNDKLANIGIGILGGQKIDLQELLNQYIKNEVNSDYKILSTFRAGAPLAPPLKRLYKDNVMITGDAARFVNSVTGGGIRMALISGGVAGITASKYINKEIDTLEIYQSSLNKKAKELTKYYNKKVKMETEKKIIRGYSRTFSVLSKINRRAPNLSQNYLLKKLRKDRSIIDAIK